jgi:hypothetical protein
LSECLSREAAKLKQREERVLLLVLGGVSVASVQCWANRELLVERERDVVSGPPAARGPSEAAS